MEAMILSAGLGTRLLPLTRQRSKPLFPILNHPLLHWTLAYLQQFQVTKVVLNTHHLAAQIEAFVKDRDPAEFPEISSRYEPEILGTGGGLSQTRNVWKDTPFVVINGDILTDIDLQKAVEFHRSHLGLVTLILHDYPEFNQIAVDRDGRIHDFRLEKGHGLAFTGIHILDRAIFKHLPSSGSYDIIPVYQEMIREGIPLWAYIAQDHYWRDIGTPRSYLKIHEELLSENPTLHFMQASFRQGEEGNVCIHPEAQIEQGVVFSGWASIGRGCRLREQCRIENAVLWEEVVIDPGIEVSDSIIGKGVSVTRNIRGEILV